MKSLTIAVSLRISSLMMVSLYMFSLLNLNAFNDILIGFTPYILIVFMIVLLLMARQQHIYEKNRSNGRLTLREKILPEFNSNDERETELTGIAAKNSFSIILVYSPIMILLVSLLFLSEVQYALLFTFLAISSIPILGLITYYFSYRYYYSK